MKSLSVQSAAFLLVGAAPLCSAQELNLIPESIVPATSTNVVAIGPRIQFASTSTDFGRIMAGQQVKHEFVFTNTGDEVPKINGVYPMCGCTTAGTWSREAEPGGTGSIPLQFDSTRFVGAVTKYANVVSNDKTQSTVRLELKGTIWKPIDVSPQTAVLNVVADSSSNATATVSIVSSLEEPITLSEPRSSNPAFTAELVTLEAGKKFQVVVRTVPPLGPGNVQGSISLKTSSTNVPSIEVSIIAVVQPAVVVMPQQIVLPPGPLNAPYPCSVSVRNNAANALSLSEATVTAEGVSLETKEILPGRQFMLTMTFPAGFQAIPGRGVGLMFKTSDPKHAVVNVPIVQNPRAAVRNVQPPQLHRGPVPPPPPSPPLPPGAGS
jgi:hypothetical protein